MRDRIATAFIQQATNLLTSGEHGLSGGRLMEITSAYAYDFGVDIPHARPPLKAPNKRTALLENLLAFEPKQQYQIIRELCDRLDPEGRVPALVTLKSKLMTEYADFADQDQATDLHRTLLVETRHWLSGHEKTRKLFDEALLKHDQGVFRRNTLDDLRLALELLLCELWSNEKSLENQVSNVGQFVRDKGGSKELANMFQKLVDYYANYQNTYVKHDDAVITSEIEIIFELTASFMKHFLRLHQAPATP